jgi:hypothetical protein
MWMSGRSMSRVAATVAALTGARCTIEATQRATELPIAERTPDPDDLIDEEVAAAEVVGVDLGPETRCADPTARAASPYDRIVLGEEPLEVDPYYLLAGGGLTVVDLDGDGRLDVLSPGEVRPWLYRQTAPDRFEEVGEKVFAGIDLTRSSAVTAADGDGDGDLDLFVTRWLRPSVYLRNLGRGDFEDATVAAGLHGPGLKQLTSAWGDLDLDGDLDLFVGGYGPSSAYEVDMHPSSDPSLLFLNHGDGTFEPGHALLPPEVHEGYTFMSAWTDLDLDGRDDLLVINDFGDAWPQRLVWNRPEGLTLDDGSAGLSLPIDGMGLSLGDVNGDEVPDLFISSQYHVYLLESRDGAWYDTTDLRELHTTTGLGSAHYFGWSTELFDADNDGDLDAFAAWGTWTAHDRVLQQRDMLWLQQADGTFVDVGQSWGVADMGSTRGTVVADVNDDGWPDLVKRILGGPTVIYRSRCGTEAWLRLRLHAPAPNTRAIGARVRVVAGDRVWSKQVQAGGQGMFSGPPPELLFGLGELDTVDLIEVHWPGGEVSRHEDIGTRRVVAVTQHVR